MCLCASSRVRVYAIFVIGLTFLSYWDRRLNRKPIHVALNMVVSLTNTYYSKPTVVNSQYVKRKAKYTRVQSAGW